MKDIETETMNIEEESNKMLLSLDGIKAKIEIDFTEKKIEKLKFFFEELIIKSFLEEKIYRIEFSEELKNRLNTEHSELIKLLNEFKVEYENSMEKLGESKTGVDK